MGVPFNFTCEGVGHYICSRCGQELFSSDDRIPKKEKPFPISFSKAIEENSVVKIPHPTPPRRRYATSTSRPSIQARGAAEVRHCGKMAGLTMILKHLYIANFIFSDIVLDCLRAMRCQNRIRMSIIWTNRTVFL